MEYIVIMMEYMLLVVGLVSIVSGVFIENVSYPISSAQFEMVFAIGSPIYYSRSYNGDIKVYEINQTAMNEVTSMSWGSPAPVFDINDDGDLMLIAQNNTVFLYSRSGAIFQQLYIYTWSTNIKSATISGDGSTGFCGGNSGQILIINLQTYTVIQTLPSVGGGRVSLLTTNIDGEYVAAAYNSGIFAVYKGPNTYSGFGSAISGFGTPKNQLKAAKNFTVICMNTGNTRMQVFERNSTGIRFVTEFDGHSSGIDDYAITEDWTFLAGEVDFDFVRIFTIDGFTFTTYKDIINTEVFHNFAYDTTGRYLMVGGSATTTTYVNCGDECLSCNLLTCDSCDTGYQLQGGSCIIPSNQTNTTNETNVSVTPCVDNVYKSSGVCEQYCWQECYTCEGTADNCTSCFKHYSLSDGACTLENVYVKVATYARPYVSILRRNWMAPFYMVLEEIWLYNYHKQDYNGTIEDIFETIRMIEDKKWALEPFVHLLPIKEKIQSHLPNYDDYSNEKFLQKEHHDQLLIKTLVEYFVFYLPGMIIMMFLLNRLFYLLFNYSISAWFRIYSFWGTLWMIAFEGNVEIFVFVLLRTFMIAFSPTFISKFILAVSTVFGFFFVVYCVVVYHIYKTLYHRLSKYYLNNMFRFGSSFVLMTLVYGIRPLLRGITHSLLYNHQIVQLHVLAVVELLTIVVMVVFQFGCECHRFKAAMFFKIVYHLAFCILNEHLVISLTYGSEISYFCDYIIFMMIGSSIFTALSLLLGDWFSNCEASSESEDDDSRHRPIILHELSKEELKKQLGSPYGKFKPNLVIDLSKGKCQFSVQVQEIEQSPSKKGNTNKSIK